MKSLLTKVLAPFLLVGTAVAGLFAAVKLGWISEETAFWLIPISFTVIFVLVALFVGIKIGRVWLWPIGTLALVQLAGTLVWLFSSILETIWSPLTWSIGAASAVLLIMLIVWAISTIRSRILEKKMAGGSGTGADLERIRKDMREALDLLRRAGQGRNAVYQLPWFLVMGRPAAGKTVAIKNSELGLPVKRDWVKGVGGTYTADWFFTNELIFLDTPGGWVTEGASEDGQETWRELMRLLRKYRGRQPLDGLIVVVPADDLLGLNEDELEDQATNVREVVDLIHEQLDFRFPIYVLVTKCDLVEGFVDFFRGLPSKRRHEILGWSNPDPNEPDAELIVEKGFSTVRGRLQNYRLEMLGKVARRTQARRLFFFTEEFRGLERPLSVFTQGLFGGDRYSEPPVFRGFYFSSGTQEGAPLGKAISGVAKAFGLPVPQAETAAEEGTKRSYFLLDLFRELMVGDEGLVGRSASHWWRRRRNTAFGVFAPAAIAVTLLLLSGFALVLNKQTYGRVEAQVPTIAMELWDTRQDTPLPTEKNIEAALARTETLRGFHREMTGFSPFRTFGMRRPSVLATRSRDMFAEEFSRTVLHPTLLGARAVTQHGTSCIERLNVLRSVVWLRTGRRAGTRHLAAMDKIWKLDSDPQQARAVRVRQELRQQYFYLKNNVDPESFDLLPGFSVLKAAQWILDDCGEQGSTSALDAYRRWQDQCKITRTPGDIVGCYQSLNQVIRTAGENYDGFVKSFEDLKKDLGDLVDEVPDGQAARDLLAEMDVAERGTSDCLTRFDNQIIKPVKSYVQRPDMIEECQQVVEAGARRERFANREAVIKQQDETLAEDADDIQGRIDRFNDDCKGAVEGFNRVDFGVIRQVASSYRRVACFERDLSAAAPTVVAIRAAPPSQRPQPAVKTASTTRTETTRPKEQRRSTPTAGSQPGTRWFKTPARINGGYMPEAVIAHQQDWLEELQAIQGAGYSAEQTEFETGRLRRSIGGYAAGFVKAWKARLKSLELQDPTPPVAQWLRDLAAAPGFTRYIEEAKAAIATIPADAEAPFDVLGQQVSSSLKIAELDISGYLALLPVIADDIDMCQQDGAFWSDYRQKVQAKNDVTLIQARTWVRDNVGPGVAGGVLTALFERPLDEAHRFIFGDDLLQSRWKDLVALYKEKIAKTAPFSSDLSDDPMEFRDLRALLGRETGAVTRILTASEGKGISDDAENWLKTAQRMSTLFFREGTDDPRPLSVVATVDTVEYEPEAFGKNYRLDELKIVIGTQIPKWTSDDDVPLQLEAVLLGDGKSEFAFVEGDVSERKGWTKRMFGKKWKPGAGVKAAGPFEGTLAPIKLLAAGLQPGATELEFLIEIDWKKKQKGIVKIAVRLSGQDAAPLMDLMRNGLPAPPAEIVEH